jgi:hypothetical protein
VARHLLFEIHQTYSGEEQMKTPRLVKHQQHINHTTTESCSSMNDSVSKAFTFNTVQNWVRERQSARRINPHEAFDALFAQKSMDGQAMGYSEESQ